MAWSGCLLGLRLTRSGPGCFRACLYRSSSVMDNDIIEMGRRFERPLMVLFVVLGRSFERPLMDGGAIEVPGASRKR